MTQIDTTDTGITIVRTFAAPLHRVFAAWTTAEHFRAWFGGDQVEVPADRCDWHPEPDRAWSATMIVPTGDEIHWDGTFKEIDHPSRFVFTIRDDSAADLRHDTVTVTLRRTPEGTEMTFTQSGPEHRDRRDFERAAQGWNGFFDVIERVATSPEPVGP